MADILTQIAVCGAGAMGSGIAQIAAQSGANVLVFDVSETALEASRSRILGSLDGLAQKGKLSPEAAQAAKDRLGWVSDLAALAKSELVIEAIIEDAGIKGQLFERLEAVLASDAIIATNTSSLPISRLARGLKHPSRFVGMHFFNPATLMKLVEVISGAATDAAVCDRVAATAKAWGKVAIPVADVPGFIVNRVARPYYAEGFTALTEGAASADVIDGLLRAAAFKMGPLELTDLIGQDVNFAVARSVFDGYFGRARFVPQLRQAALVDAGWLGRKTGQGVYAYPTGPQPVAGEPQAAAISPAQQGAAEALRADSSAWIECDGVMLGQTQGSTAKRESKRQGRSVALFDWIATGEGVVAYAASDDQAAETARAVLAALGRPAVRVSDRPGLIVARTLAQVANAAADAVLERVADEAGIDAALRFGANYPFGPFAWADGWGREALVTLLDAIADETGEALYKASHYLRATA